MTTADPSLELATAGMEVEGALQDASNITVRVHLLDADGARTGQRALYKPIRGEAPLVDFPDGTLALREVAAYVVSRLGGWDLVPETVLRDGPLGPGSVQRWINWEETGHDPGDGLLEIFPQGQVGPGWRPIVHGEDGAGTPIVVAHRGSAALRSLAVLDVVLNNADRKGAHLLRAPDGRVWAVDHGLTLHAHDKLRTVLWGFAGESVAAEDRARLQRLDQALAEIRTPGAASPADTGSASEGAAVLAELLDAAELKALRRRVRELVADPVLPAPPTSRYPLPWPLW